ncbi:carbohydrate-binding protein [Hymenobacter perfusus]|uniref:Carbohydrate-binding protein n=1 Tax=Hymenobacter perfusus TaxID=1236770 RepID=A0A3R9NCR6_9BACT|nr:carbohydrate-binding protein [Hymenobacter perfusus]RSK44233.1 carbohydrate-binding protein [Hymenobacter perfusus]
MKRLYSYGIGTALLLGSLPALAQNRPAGPAYSLGSSQALVQQLETQVAADAARRQRPTVALRVSAATAFTGKVNFRQDLSKTGEYVVGEIQDVPNSSFFLRIEGAAVEGNILLKNTKQAYRYSADKKGRVIVQEVDIDKVICLDYNKPVGYRDPVPSPATANRAAVVSLQSYPGARGCIMLDFDGYYVPAGGRWNNGNPINAAGSGMSDAAIQEFWEVVSEDYRPFSMNVTTDENVFNSYPKNMRMRCVVTPTNTAAPGAGGVAYIGAFSQNTDEPCWVFVLAGKSGGDAASHEVGHTMGLGHDGRNNPAEGYYTGQDNSGPWAPIMGAGYYKPVAQWSRGEYNRANNQEDDLAILASTTWNVGYRNDDHSNGLAGATALARSGNSLSGSGIIERTVDQDYFSFSTSGGAVTLNLSTVGRHGNLDIVGRLFNSSGGLVGAYDTQGSLSTTLSANLAAGTYYLQIDGTSFGNPATDGYSDYASLGTFSISGTAPAAVSGVATVFKDCNYTGTAVSLPVGDYNLAAMQARGILNDDISSLTVNGGYQVVLYENDNFTGTSLTITGGNTCLVGNTLGTGNWNDKATSLRVQPASSAFSVTLQAEAASVNSGMTVEACSEGGQNVGYVDAGDYLVWNGINFPASGTYTIEYRVASPSGGTISADLNAGGIQFGNSAIPGTGGWQNWATVSKTVTINAGTYNFGIYAQTGGWNLNWVRITKAGTARMASVAASDVSLGDAAEVLELYPNPVTDRLLLRAAQDLTGSQYQILDSWGRPVLSGAGGTGSIDVSGLKPGMYVLRLLTADKEPVTRRFQK